MKKTLLIFVITLLTGQLFAQVPGRAPNNAAKPPLPLREVSGIVKDTTDETVIGATVKLKTATDSVSTTTNADGIFVFKNVKSATFVITITSVGYAPIVKRMLNNDAVPRLVLDPFILQAQKNMLAEVVINGTPSITYKTDTVEYRASDYKVRENATVDELLKKMEGMEVGTDGSVTHQGQQVTRARLNGKDYSGGDVANAIQNLPADIVEKIQIVDDYGDQAARTGIKNGDPQKVLNITTRADRSVGNLARISGGAGNNGRYEAQAFGQRINGNQQIGVSGNYRNTINGVASTGIAGGSAGGAAAGGGGGRGGGSGGSSGGGGGSGGTTTSGGPSFNYRDHWGKKVEVNASYRYNFNDVHSINKSNGEQYSTLGTTFFDNQSDRRNNSKNHNVTFELEYSIDSANFLRVTPSFSFSGASSINTSMRTQTGLIHQDIRGFTGSDNTTPNYGGIVFYQHIFKKPRRNFSIQVNYNSANNEQENDQNNIITYYNDSTSTKKDSLVNRFISRGNLSKNIRTSLTYVEPLSEISQLEFNAQVNYRGYDNKAYTSNVDAAGNRSIIDSLSNVFNYGFTETRIALNYRLNKLKYNLSLGVTAVPTLLEGSKERLGTSIHRTNFNLIPIVRFQYMWSRQERFTVNYSGTPSEPTFDQIQPVRDETNPQNPIIGNPNLKPSFTHSINTEYNNYIVNSKLNISANINTRFVSNQIVTNTLQVPTVIISGTDTVNNRINETYYTNLNGSYSVNGNYNISKQLDDRKYNLSLIGNVTYNHRVSMSNNVQNTTTTWRFNERFGPRINPTERIEVNPFVSYDLARSFFTLPNSKSTNISTVALSIDGRFFFLKNQTLLFGYSASKNYVSGLPSNVTSNPLVINGYIEKQFFKRKNATLRLQVFDILKQNNFVSQTITENSVTNTLTNALSRYFMLSFRVNLQKWSGTPSRNGRTLRRRGDGSFID
jgi:uncharacterized membrane protein YgcG